MRLRTLDLAFQLSLLTGAIWLVFIIKMSLFPTVTEEPSLINCFNYIDPTKAKIIFAGGATLCVVTIVLAIKRSKFTVALIEALGLWTVAYLILVAVSSAPYAISISNVSQTLTTLGCLALLWLIGVRALVNQNARIS